MSWLWYVAIALQVLADLFFFTIIIMLVLAQSTITNHTKAIARATLMLYKTFGLDTMLTEAVEQKKNKPEVNLKN